MRTQDDRGEGQENDGGASSRRRKKRTSIEPSIRLTLEKIFLQNSKPNSDEISQVAQNLKMEKEVRRCFCYLVSLFLLNVGK